MCDENDREPIGWHYMDYQQLQRIANTLERIANSLETLVSCKNKLNLTPVEEAIVAGATPGKPEEKIATKAPEENSGKGKCDLPYEKLDTKRLIRLFKESSKGLELYKIYLEMHRRNGEGKVTKEEAEQFSDLLSTPEKACSVSEAQAEFILTRKRLQEEPVKKEQDSELPYDKLSTKHLLGLAKECSDLQIRWDIFSEITNRRDAGKLTESEEAQAYAIFDGRPHCLEKEVVKKLRAVSASQLEVDTSEPVDCQEMSENDPLPHW